MKPFFIIQNLFFFALLKPIILQPAWQAQKGEGEGEKHANNSAVFHNFARQIALIQYPGRSKHMLPLRNKLQNRLHYKTFSRREFHNARTVQSEKMLLCDMQGNNHGLLVKTTKNSQNHLFGQPDGFSLLTSTKFALRLIELLFTLQHDRELLFLGFISLYV